MARLNLLLMCTIILYAVISDAVASEDKTLEVGADSSLQNTVKENSVLRETRSAGKKKKDNPKKAKGVKRSGKGKRKSAKKAKGVKRSGKGKRKSAKKAKGGKRTGKGKRRKSAKRTKGGKRTGKGKRRKSAKRAKGGKRTGKGKIRKSAKKAKGRKRTGKGKRRKSAKKAKGKRKSRNGKKRKNAKKAKGGKKTKKEKARKNINRKNNKKGTVRQNKQGANSDACVEGLASLGGFFGNQARNYLRQATRAKTKSEQKGKKGKKKDDFKVPYNYVLAAAGGNATSPTCKGKAPGTNDTLSGVVSSLKSCDVEILDKCNKVLSADELTTVESCLTATNAFRAKYLEDFTGNPSPNAATICTRVNSSAINQLKDDVVKNCKTAMDVTAVEKNQTSEKKVCDKAFQACRKAERETTAEIDRCKVIPLKCELSANLTSAEAKIELDIATSVRNALLDTEKKFGDALKAAGKDKGTGDNGELPTSASGNNAAADETAGCNAVKDGWKKFNETGDAAVQSPDQPKVDKVKADAAIAALNDINSRTTLEADLKSCKSDTGRQVTIFRAIIQIRFYVFWCGWFRIFVIDIRITIISITFPQPITTQAPTIAASTTAAVTGASTATVTGASTATVTGASTATVTGATNKTTPVPTIGVTTTGGGGATGASTTGGGGGASTTGGGGATGASTTGVGGATGASTTGGGGGSTGATTIGATSAGDTTTNTASTTSAADTTTNTASTTTGATTSTNTASTTSAADTTTNTASTTTGATTSTNTASTTTGPTTSTNTASTTTGPTTSTNTASTTTGPTTSTNTASTTTGSTTSTASTTTA